MSEHYHEIIPIPPQPQAAEAIQAHQITREFYQEIEYRQEFEAYCQWYDQIAAQNRRDLQQMRKEFNFFRLFSRRS